LKILLGNCNAPSSSPNFINFILYYENGGSDIDYEIGFLNNNNIYENINNNNNNNYNNYNNKNNESAVININNINNNI